LRLHDDFHALGSVQGALALERHAVCGVHALVVMLNDVLVAQAQRAGLGPLPCRPRC
jgi:hypothetical protein